MIRNAEKNGKGCSIMGKVFRNSQMTEEPKSVGNSVIDYGRFLVTAKYAYLHRYLNVKRGGCTKHLLTPDDLTSEK